MSKLPTKYEMTKFQVEEQARATQKVNSELIQQVTQLEQKLQDERDSMDEKINFERGQREQLEQRLEEERADRERMMELERTSREEFEKTMMAKFQLQFQLQIEEFSKQIETVKTQTNKVMTVICLQIPKF
jgi:DNA anti-recombination protein RmuC